MSVGLKVVVDTASDASLMSVDIVSSNVFSLPS